MSDKLLNEIFIVKLDSRPANVIDNLLPRLISI